jgi:hypothetical protein
MTNSTDMIAFAISLQQMTRDSQDTINANDIIRDLVSSTFFLDTMRDAALRGESSANLLSFNDSSIIAFRGDDETTATWKIIPNGIWDDDYSHATNLIEFVHTPSFQIALAKVFPLPFVVNVWADCVEVKW